MRYLAPALLLLSCGSTADSCPSTGTALTYENFGAAFVQSYCVSCHGGDRTEDGVDLTTKDGVMKWATVVVNQAGTRTTMPPSGSTAPSSAERAQLVEWLSCGSD